jgi:hypothetical protein
MKFYIKKFAALLILASIVGSVSQAFLIPPKTAQAQGAEVAATVPTSDIPTIIERIAIGIARGILERFTETFLTRFTNQLVNKYKIRNYLYYDQVLTDYYINRYIADNINDPDLRNIYSLLNRAYVTGQSTGTTGGPDPRAALVPRIKAAISQAYINRGGIDPQRIYNPSSFNSDREYFAAAQAYFSNPRSFTEQNLYGEYGSFQSSATTAAQLEILVGNGLKAGRIIGGTCSVSIPNPNPTTCAQAGGTWEASAVDQARSFIDNPSVFVQNHLDAAIKQHFGNLYNPSTDFWTQIGRSFGRIIWNQLGLDRSGGTLPDAPTVYAGQDYGNPGATPPGTPLPLGEGEIDIDGDGIVDGTDYTGDGIIDICSYGGTPPNACVGSASIITGGGGEPPAVTCAEVPTALACTVPDHTALVAEVQAYLIGLGQYTPGVVDNCANYEVVRRVAWELRAESTGMVVTFHSSRCPASGIAGDLVGYPDNSVVDILVAGITPSWQRLPANGPPESGVSYTAAVDPGDPADACYKTMSCP